MQQQTDVNRRGFLKTGAAGVAGATVGACAEALLEAGARAVGVVTLARATLVDR